MEGLDKRGRRGGVAAQAPLAGGNALAPSLRLAGARLRSGPRRLGSGGGRAAWLGEPGAGVSRPDAPERGARAGDPADQRPRRPCRGSGGERSRRARCTRQAGPVRGTVHGGREPAQPRALETTLDGRIAVWRLRVVSDGAVSLNFGFTRYWMPPGGRLRVHTPDGAEVLGPYTDADNEEHGQLWTPVLSGDDAVIEVAVPVDRIGELDLGLAKVNRGFRDLASVRSPSGFRNLTSVASSGGFQCHVDVACSEGDDWRDQIRSVGDYSVDGMIASCTGALVNNTAEDGTPYFLTARHCFTDPSAQAPSVVVYWNYQRSVCGGSDGTRSDSQSGAVLRVSRAEPTWPPGPDSVSDTDTVLLELDDAPNPAHHVYLAGWDAGSSVPTSAVGIHHPFN